MKTLDGSGVIVFAFAIGCGPQVEVDGFGSGSSGDDPGSSTRDRPSNPVTSVGPDTSPPDDTSSDATDTIGPTTVSTSVSTSATTDPPDPSGSTGIVEPWCGDGEVGPGEQCDGDDLEGFTCADLGLGPGGTLGCAPDTCTFDTSMCAAGEPFCGDGMVGPGEQCDGMDLQGFDCDSLGLGGGRLSCAPATCTFDTSACRPESCGNGVINPGEQCDGNDLQGFDCASLGLGGGTLACDPMICTFDTSMCNP